MRKLSLTLLVFLGVSLAFFGGMIGVAWLCRPDVSRAIPQLPPDELARIEAERDVRFDPNDLPTLYRDIVVRPKNQSPLLDGLDVPPVHERLPEVPAVMEGPDGIGKYGGTWLRLANAPSDVEIISWRLAGPFLVRWSPLGYPIQPHVAQSVEPNADKTVWTVKLRKGLRWSDGHPYTADDILYWWEAEALHTMLNGAPPSWMIVGGKPGTVEKIDDYTVVFRFDQPHAAFLEYLASAPQMCEAPRHYLKPFHPDPAIGDAEVSKRTMAMYGLASPAAAYRHMKQVWNPEHPRLWPWVYRTFRSSPPQVFVRNPYYFVVDPAGNQLPYIDRVQFDVQDSKMLSLTAANGGVSMQTRHIYFKDYTELMSRREIAGTRILHWYSASRTVYTINPNLNRRIDPDDPATTWKAQLLGDKRFRQALSLAIDREQIIRADYSGIGEPSQVSPGPESPFHHERASKAFTAYDPQRAAQLLDEIGLTQRDGEGFRTFPDGSKMSFYFDITSFTGPGPAQFIIDDWAAVGVRAILRERTRPLFYTEKDGMDFDFNVWTGESDFNPLVSPRYFIPLNTESFYVVGWGKWYMRGGFHGGQSATSKGSIPVPRDHPMYAAIESYEAALRAPTFDEQKRYMDRVLDIAAENVWSISIATPPPQLVVVSKDLRNVPENALYGAIYATPANAGMEAYYFENPSDSPGAIADMRSALQAITPRPTVSGGDAAASHLLRWLIIGAASLMLVMAVRHPFIGRRLMIMAPTLLIISVLVFTVIQLPPGDFLTARIIQLQESGDEADLRQIDDLRTLFHTDDPVWVQYLRWMGLRWFVTFDPSDAGLLQGNMGRSMETGQPINNMIGDRILLTIVISLGTILFTWAIAIPIGIYSAVRQYSIADHVLTLAGFLGMCIPSFLLALVLMAAAGVSGLFSPQYAAQPEWTWAKVIDLLKHVWIPIVVLGAGGTAGMIRVMRANLLDELRKPYVITAMAKGVRPVKLLLKYPVRIALNPFVSGIGALFPQIVSGGAIVAMVLALPTVGPLLLQALFTEDMYLAGSMLMILSLLAVIGTLVSDLLLLWLDPRIRYEGGTR